MNFNEMTIKTIPSSPKGWSGGLAYKDGIIYETNNGKVIGLRDSDSGNYVGKLTTDANQGVKDIAYDVSENGFWGTPAGGYDYYHLFDWISGKTIRMITRPKFAFGIFTDPGEPGVLWCADQIRNRAVKISTKDGHEILQIKLTFPPRGIARNGEFLWFTRAGEVGEEGYLYKTDMNGKMVDSCIFPSSKYSHDAGGMDFDSDGYLWAHGGKYTCIYKLDTGEQPAPVPEPPTPTPPTPEPPPEAADDDSGNIFDIILKLFKRIFG